MGIILNPTDVKKWGNKEYVSREGYEPKGVTTNSGSLLLTTISGTVQDTGLYLPKALITQQT